MLCDPSERRPARIRPDPGTDGPEEELPKSPPESTSTYPINGKGRSTTTEETEARSRRFFEGGEDTEPRLEDRRRAEEEGASRGGTERAENPEPTCTPTSERAGETKRTPATSCDEEAH